MLSASLMKKRLGPVPTSVVARFRAGAKPLQAPSSHF
jgi:hypothetical protein